MFRKLLKYEWRANARLFWILSLAALGIAVLGGGVLRTANFIAETSTSDVAIALVVPGLYLMFFFCCLALVIYAAAVEFINLYRFYKNKFTDEGYLTFTLPVKTRDIFLSSMVNILLWMLISLVVTLGCFALMLTIGLGDLVRDLESDVTFQYFLSEIAAAFEALGDEMASYPGYRLYVALTVMIMILSPFYSVMLMMSCITVGCVLAKKHKILASIGIYYLANMVYSTVTSTMSSVLTLTVVEMENFYVGYNTVYICQIVLMAGIIVGGYFLSTHLMKNKLNLP